MKIIEVETDIHGNIVALHYHGKFIAYRQNVIPPKIAREMRDNYEYNIEEFYEYPLVEEIDEVLY